MAGQLEFTMTITSWDQLLKAEMQKPYLQNIRAYLDTAYQNQEIYPPKDRIFAALDACPLDQIKVVILGQDPYHNIGQAMGYAFSVPEGMKIPPSLHNIYEELKEEFQQPFHRSGDLSDWAAQGVLLLNPILTVEAHKPLSHKDLGWQQFTDEVLKTLDAQNQPIVFLLWGGQARKARRFLHNPNHLILESAHPSPLSAYRGFFGCGHFRKANDFLQAHGTAGINWIADNIS